MHRVIVSRGYEYELVDTEVTVSAGQTVQVLASLERSVDAPGALSADMMRMTIRLGGFTAVERDGAFNPV